MSFPICGPIETCRGKSVKAKSTRLSWLLKAAVAWGCLLVVTSPLAAQSPSPGSRIGLPESSAEHEYLPSPAQPSRLAPELNSPLADETPVFDEHSTTECEDLEAPVHLPVLPQAPAPLLIMTRASTASDTWSLSSADTRAGWIPVDFQHLRIACEVPESSSPKAIAFYLDGQPYGGVRPFARPILEIPAPPTGRHLIQARYLDSDLGWSRISTPIRFEILVPPAPTILSVHDAQEPSGPVNSHAPAEITSGNATLKLAHVAPGACIDVYVDGRHVANRHTSQTGCIEFPVWRYCESGSHIIRVRQSAGHSSCAISSLLSEPVTIHYYRNADSIRETPPELVQLDDSSDDGSPAKQAAVTSEAKKCPTDDRADSCDKYDYRRSYIFKAPAHFPLQQFSIRGEPDDRDGIFIYEGMKLSVWNNGAYKLEFRTSIPRVPASIRLQLLVRLSNGSWHTITLTHAYIRGASEVGKATPLYTNGQTIEKTGFLTGFTPSEVASGIVEVRREGTAHFGYERAQTTTIWKQ